MLESVKFVVVPNGRRPAVQMRIGAWNAVPDWLEEYEDQAIVKDAITKLRLGPKAAGALRWGEVRAEWDSHANSV